METRLFLVELQNRPDGIVNQTINSYSTPATTMSMFYQRFLSALRGRVHQHSVYFGFSGCNGPVCEHYGVQKYRYYLHTA